MRDGLTIEITYQSFGKDEPTTFEIEPYFVKLFKQRWYVIGRSTYDRIRIYALDRIQFMIATKTQFDFPVDFNPEDYFINCFGIIADETVPVQKVLIKVWGSKVKYLRSLPLHQSQQELETFNDYSIFQYFIRPTYDFRQELLSYAAEIEVIVPDKLREDFRNIVAEMLNHYK
jgi:predicted DNA-binding transcriptional regulator YafY